MSRINELPTGNDFENIVEAAEAIPEGVQTYLTDALPIARNQTFSLSHKNPELQAVLNQSEIQNASYEIGNEQSLNDAFMDARKTLVEHFTAKLSTLPPEVREDFLKSLDLQTNYKPNFPLHAQILKSSFA